MNGDEHDTGNATIEESGFHPGEGNAYEYRSGSHHFWFYCDMKQEGDLFVVRIRRASTKRFGGSAQKLNEPDLRAITDNIRRYFAAQGFDVITFEWAVK